MNNQENIKFDLIEALSRLNVHDHLCLIYETHEEQLAAVIPFIRMGLERGEQCVYIIDENTMQVVLDAMRADGIDVDSAIKSGALEVLTKREAYLRDGYFNPDSMISFLKDAVDSAKKAGFSALRVTGEMTWALGNESGLDLLIEYEAKLNYFIPNNDILAICQYNRSRFKPEIINDIIRTHPLVIYGSIICKNFYYIPPDEFLKPKDQQVFLEAQRLLNNIIERKRTEEEIYRLASIVESSVDAIISKTLQGIIISWNPGAEKLYGYSEKEVIGKSISILIPPGHFDEMPRILERIKHGETIDHYEAVRLRKNGNQIYVSLTISPLKDTDGRIIGASTITRDITEHRKMELQLSAASLYARNLIETSLDPLVTINPDGKITDVNKATEYVTGFSRIELIGSDFSNYFTEPEKARKGYQDVFEKGFIRDYPLAIRHTSGSTIDVLYNAAIYTDANGNVAGVFAAARDITKRKLAEEEIKRERNKSRLYFETAGAMFVIINTEQKVELINHRGCEILGYPRNEIIGKNWFDNFVPERLRGDIKEVFLKLISGEIEPAEYYENEILDRNGEERLIAWHNRLVRDDNGRIIETISSGEDITDRKRMENELKESEERYRRLFETSKDGLLLINKESGHIIAFNPAIVELLGYSEEEFTGKRLEDIVLSRGIDNFEKLIQDLKKTGFIHYHELSIMKRDGKKIDAEVYFVNRAKAIQCNVRDLTERKQAELEYRTIISTTRDGFWLMDIQGQFLDVNDAYCDLIGYSRDELLSMKILDVEINETLEESLKHIEWITKSGFDRFETRHRKKDGGIVDIDVSVNYSETGGGRLFVFLRDITDRKQAQEELEKYHEHLEELVRERTSELAEARDRAESADRLKSTFLATMSHELRTPLNSIIGFTGIMLKGLAGPLNDEQTKQMGMVKNSADHLLSLINDVLDISKIEAGQVQMSVAPFDMRNAIETAVKSLEPLAMNKGLPINVEVAPNVGMIIGDRRRVEQILFNLLHNAIKFTEHGEVRVKCHVENGSIITHIIDTGIGIKPEQMENLFKPFVQLESGIIRRYEGTGLGLSISKKLVEMQGGQIKAESAWGKGSTFTFSLLQRREEP